MGSNIRFFCDQEEFARAISLERMISAGVFISLTLKLAGKAYRLHYPRQWYCCAGPPTTGIQAFVQTQHSRSHAYVLVETKKGMRFSPMDPTEGPLDDLEVSGLLNALRAASKNGALDLVEQAALWLCVALGPNPLQMCLLREDDVKVVPDADGHPAFIHLDVPRIKKGDANRRDAFRPRKLTWEIGEIVLALAAENGARRAGNPDLSLFPSPLFTRSQPSSLAGGPMDEYAMHHSPSAFTAIVARAVRKLGVVSHRTGLPLVVTTRRLRYTYASRLVREGVPKRVIADLLDHSDLQNVQVYFDIKSDIVGPLDKAMALTLGPIAQAFLGKLVRSEGEAKRGGDPSSRIAVPDLEADAIRPVGTCGSYGFCGLMAPVACYTCTSFQPWSDAPHHVLLDRLLADRERKVADGRDGRMVSIHDDTIMAIGDVVARIEASAAA